MIWETAKAQRYVVWGGIISLVTLGFMVLGGVFAETQGRRKNK